MSPKRPSPADRPLARQALPRPVVAAVDAVISLVEGVAFWLAVTLPFAYLPALVLGVESATAPRVLAALVVLHVAALAVGNGYRQPVS